MSDDASRRARGRAIVVDMSSAPVAKKLDVDPLEAAFDNAPWDDKLATEEEEGVMREVRAAETGSTAEFLPAAEVTAETAERVRLKR